MTVDKKKYLKLLFVLFILIAIVLCISIFQNKLKKNAQISKQPITINLIANVHPSLPWSFKSLNKRISVLPGEVKTIEYIVENLENGNNTGIATFAYSPKELGKYIRKLNCFCFDAQTLKAKQSERYSLVLLIDPEVTKDSKTKGIKEVTLQFTFFDYKKYNEGKS